MISIVGPLILTRTVEDGSSLESNKFLVRPAHTPSLLSSKF